MPLDRDDERGNVVLDGSDHAHVFPSHELALKAIDDTDWLDQGGATYISHHAEGQCPEGKRWTGRPRRAEAQTALDVG